MRARRSFLLTLVSALVLSVTVLVPSAVGTPVWTPPATLGAGGSHMTLASNDSGRAVAAWAAQTDLVWKIFGAFRSPGGGWGTPRLISSLPEQYVGSIRLVLDDAGRATVLVTSFDTGCQDCVDVTSHVRASNARFGGVWATPTQVAVTGSASSDLAVDGAGTATAVWSHSLVDGGPRRLSFSTRPAGGTWTSASDVATGSEGEGSLPALAAAPDGTLSLLAMTRSAGKADLVGFTRPAGGAWGAPQVVDTAEVDYYTRILAVTGPTGAVTAAALLCGSASTTGPCRVETVQKNASSSTWSAPDVRQTLPRGPSSSVFSAAALSVERDGTPVLAWKLPAEGAPLAVSRRTSSGWEAPTILSTDTATLRDVDVATNRAGATVAGWLSYDGRTQSVFASYRSAAGSWQSPVLVGSSTLFPDTRTVEVAATGTERFTTAFQARSGASYSDRVDDTTVPSARMTGPRSTSTRPSFRVSWSASDTPAGVATSDVRRRAATWRGTFGPWSRWESATTARSATHAGVQGRTYCFAVRANDRAGHTSAWSAERCTATPVDDRAARTSAGWRRTKVTGSYLGTETTTSRHGRRLTLSGGHGRRYALVATTCRACGSVQVSLGGKVVKRLSLRTRRTVKRHVLPVATYGSVHTGRLVVTVTSSGRPVRVDGVVVAR